MKTDMHMHTDCSDGRLSPEGLLEKCRDAGIRILSFTDHDSIKAYDVPAVQEEKEIQIVRGIEISASISGREVHLLGYGFDDQNDEIRSYCMESEEMRLRRGKKMAEKCRELGYMISPDELPEGTNIGRPHVARLLVREGYFRTVREAFSVLLHPGGPAYIPKKEFPFHDMIGMIHQAGGRAVLAHPLLLRDDGLVDSLMEMGIDGVEVWHPRHMPADVWRYSRMAAEKRLSVTGGSDFHGIPGRWPEEPGLYMLESEQIKEFLEDISVLWK